MPSLKLPKAGCAVTERVIRAYQETRVELWRRWIGGLGGAARVCGGCASAYCCYQLPLAHIIEGIVAARYLVVTEQPDMIDRAMEQGQRQHAIWSASCIALAGCATLAEADAVAEAGAGEWYTRREPCVFLHKDRCSIYPVRPSMCATYYIRDRCTRWIPTDEKVPTADNTDVIAVVMDASDLTLALLTGDGTSRAAPMPFAFAVGIGARLLAGQPVEALAV